MANMHPKIGGRTSTSGKGRPKGIPNKSTTQAREAIAAFVDGNAHQLQDWLNDVAKGVPRRNAKGEILYDDEGNVRWIITPSPEKAFTLFQTVIEYHVPKLARQEIAGDKDAPLHQVITWES